MHYTLKMNGCPFNGMTTRSQKNHLVHFLKLAQAANTAGKCFFIQYSMLQVCVCVCNRRGNWFGTNLIAIGYDVGGGGEKMLVVVPQEKLK